MRGKLAFCSAVLLSFLGVAFQSSISAASTPTIQYVATNGNDSNNGLSWATAKLTLAAAVTTLGGPGGVINVGPGTFATSNVSLPSNTSLIGSGEYVTILQLPANSPYNTTVLYLGSVGDTISEITFDGNKTNQSSYHDTVSGSVAVTSVSQLSIRRCQFINAYSHGLGIITAQHANGGPSHIDVEDNDFEYNGTNDGSDTSGLFGDVYVPGCAYCKVSNNRFYATGGSAIAFGVTAYATPTNELMSDNIFHNVAGMSVALGGGEGLSGGSDVIISNNTFDSSNSVQNIIDLAYWRHVNITGNFIRLGSTAVAGSGIGDAPSAEAVSIVGNRFVGLSPSSAPATQNCVGLGASNVTLQGNYCSYAGGAGFDVLGAGNTSNWIVEGNIIFDNSQNTALAHAGVETYTFSQGNTESHILIKNNRIYDDETSPRQGYGVGIAFYGIKTGYSTFTVVGNDLYGNGSGTLLNNTSGPVGFVINTNTPSPY